ncbi:hypothetical protein AB0D37_43740 [Streptomyces sp. NPDC048384]|uniref:hypothetical protein n=1 Tax=Streptomyces sp. NPDC048384 TaxID=3155487 RepID=UPI0034151D36
MLTFAVALKNKGVPVPEVAKKLTIKVGKNAGTSPSVASLYRALAEAEAAATDDGLPLRPKPVRIRQPEDPMTAEEIDLRERLQARGSTGTRRVRPQAPHPPARQYDTDGRGLTASRPGGPSDSDTQTESHTDHDRSHR